MASFCNVNSFIWFEFDALDGIIYVAWIIIDPF